MTRREKKAIEKVYGVLAAVARAEAPRETCGLIEWDGRAMHLLHCQNVAQEPETSFLLDFEDQLRALEGIERRGTEAWGVFHSHPHEGAAPSVRDREFARLLDHDWQWVIVGLVPRDGADYEIWAGDPRNDTGAPQ